MKKLANCYEDLAEKYNNVMTVSLTHLQESVPVSYGEIFRAIKYSIERDAKRISQAMNNLLEVNLGGNIIGNSANTSSKFVKKVIKYLAEFSGEDLSYLDPETNEKYVPYCVEPAVGVDRVFLTVLCDAYEEQEIAEGDVRTVLHLHPSIAPYKAAVLPLSKKLSEKATEVFERISKKFMCEYDEAGSIGKRYRREDEIGTPYCITVDFETENDDSVTIRDRDTMEQVRVKIDELENWLDEKINK